MPEAHSPLAFVDISEGNLLLATHLSLFICPVCHSSLQLAQTTIRCTGCDRCYPIVDGLPVLIAARAKITPTSAGESAS
jgi:uncharacterized protein YbaR (Trm112 family)